MFHTYVLASSGTEVDFDRASFLMDDELLEAALRAMRRERDTNPRWDSADAAQWTWNTYCKLHVDRYGDPFGPDVIRGWDRLPSTKPAPT